MSLIQEEAMPYLFLVFGYLYLQMRVFNLVPLPDIPYIADYIFDAKGLPLYIPFETETSKEKDTAIEDVMKDLNKVRDDILTMYHTLMSHIDKM